MHERRTWQLYVKITDKSSTSFFAKYKNFIVLSEDFKYQLHISNYLYGTAGDSLSPHNNMKFTTKDEDNDMRNYMNCATRCSERCGWWHNGCYDAALSMTWYGGNGNNIGRYTPGPVWYYVHGNRLPLKSSTMMFRENK